MYCTTEDILKAMPDSDLESLTNDDGDNGINTDIIENHILDNSILIDGYIRNVYQVPYGDNHILKIACIQLTVASLYNLSQRINEYAEKQYKAGIQTLRDIQAGRIVLDTVPMSVPVGISVRTKQRKFNDELMQSFRDS